MDGYFSKGMSLSGPITDLTSGNMYIYTYPIPFMYGIFPYHLAYLLWFSCRVNIPFVPWILCMGIWCISGMKNDQPWRALPFLKSHLRYITRSLLRIRDFSYNPIVNGMFRPSIPLDREGWGDSQGISSWWFQPLWKICSSNWTSFPYSDENKNIWVATNQVTFGSILESKPR